MPTDVCGIKKKMHRTGSSYSNSVTFLNVAIDVDKRFLPVYDLDRIIVN